MNNIYRPQHQKKQTSRDQYLQSSISVIDGAGIKGTKQRPFNYEAAVAEFRSWVYAAVMLNANAVASLPLRLYVQVPKGKQVRDFRTRPVQPYMKRYLTGRTHGANGVIGPHKKVMRKIIEFGDDFQEVTDSHPVLDLLQNVNPWFNGYDLIQLMVMYLELTGNAYMHPIIGKLDTPIELWPMPSQWVWIQPGRENFIDGYVYGRDSVQQLEFEPDEVIQFRYPNPGRHGLFYGMGKVEAAWGAVSLNTSNHEMDLAFSDNHARPDYVAIVKGSGGDQLDRFERNVENKLRGSRNAGRFISVEGDVTFQPLNFPPKDLMGRDEVVEEIAAIFGPPVSMLKANDPNLASAKSGYAMWRETAVLSISTLIEQKLNEQLMPMFGFDGNAVLAFDNPVPADREFELRESVGLVGAGVKLRNEDREDRGWEPVEGGDELLVPAGLVPIDQAGQPQPGFGSPFGLGSPQPAQAPPAAIAASAAPIDKSLADRLDRLERYMSEKSTATTEPAHQPISVDDVVEKVSANITKQIDGLIGAMERWPVYLDDSMTKDGEPISHKTTIYGDCTCGNEPGYPMSFKGWRTTKVDADDDVRDEQPQSPEDRLRVAIAEVLQEFGSMVEGRTGKRLDGKVRVKITTADINATLRQLEGLTDRLNEAISDPIKEMIGAGGSSGISRLIELGDIPDDLVPSIQAGFDVQNPEVARFVENQNIRLAGKITEVTIERVRSVLLDGLDQGLSPVEIADSIQDTGMFSQARAEAIARTESASAYVEGEKEAWRQSNVVKGVEWLLAPGACEFCQAVAAKFNDVVQPLNKPFLEQGTVLTGTDGGKMNLDFKAITGPPLHPNDRCDLVPVLRDL